MKIDQTAEKVTIIVVSEDKYYLRWGESKECQVISEDDAIDLYNQYTKQGRLPNLRHFVIDVMA